MDQGSRVVDVIVGLFVVAGLAAVAFLAVKVSNLADIGGGGDGYTISANFDNVGGLRPRAPVRIAGVRVGQVESIGYDEAAYAARVTMRLNSDFSTLPEDSSASILTAGLLGEQYIGLQAGGEEVFLVEGGELSLTQSALVLEEVIGQFIFEKASQAGARSSDN